MEKRFFLVWIAHMAVIGAVVAQNPIISGQFTADPTARVFDGKIYLYPSHDIPSPVERLREWFCMADYHVFSSDNLTDWTDHGIILSQDKVPWVAPDSYAMWAPDCIYRDGKYYFYFPAQPVDTTSGRGFRIGVAVADSPTGPFVPRPEPIAGVNGIDPCAFIDGDVQGYLYWSGGGMFVAPLKDNMTEIASGPMRIEGLPEGGGLKEGPFLFERAGKYYYTFPWVIEKTEALVYCMGDSPMGPFEYKGVIMDEHLSGCWTNHHSIVEYGGQWYLFYHHNDYSPAFDKNRSVRIDSLSFNGDGTIRKVTPTLRGVGITDGRRKINIDRYSNISDTGARIEFLDPADTFRGWKTVFDKDGAWVRYNAVDLGDNPPERVKARVYAPEGGILSVRLTEEGGRKEAARLNIPAGRQWTVVTTSVDSSGTGVVDLFVTAEGDNTVEINWVAFE